MTRLCLVALAPAGTLVGSPAPSVAGAQSKKSAVCHPDAAWRREAPAGAGIDKVMRPAIAAVKRK